jgi:DNA adenine methylase
MGGKSRIAKEIASVMLAHSAKREVYVEPFLGGGAVAEHMCPHFEHKFLSDLHHDLMLMWRALLDGWKPPEVVSPEEYKALRDAAPSALRGFVGFGGSFGGKWFGGYAKGGVMTDGTPRNHQAESARNLLKGASKLAGAKVSTAGYQSLPAVPAAPLIYCDPPYADTTGYSTDSFDSEAFWAKAQSWAEKGADVFVSEYTAPEGWEVLYERDVKVSTNTADNRHTATEKLFTWKGTACVSS